MTTSSHSYKMITSAFDRTVSATKSPRDRFKTESNYRTDERMSLNQALTKDDSGHNEDQKMLQSDDEEVAVNCYRGAQSDFESSDDEEMSDESGNNGNRDTSQLVMFVRVPLNPSTPLKRPEAHSPSRCSHAASENEPDRSECVSDNIESVASSVGARGVGFTFGTTLEEDNETSDLSEDETTVAEDESDSDASAEDSDDEDIDEDADIIESDHDLVAEDPLYDHVSELIAEDNGSVALDYDESSSRNEWQDTDSVSSLREALGDGNEDLDEELTGLLATIDTPDKSSSSDLVGNLIGVAEDRGEHARGIVPKPKRVLSYIELANFIERQEDTPKRSKLEAATLLSELPPLDLGPAASTAHLVSYDTGPPSRTLSEINLEFDFNANKLSVDSQLRQELSPVGNGDSRENSPVDLLTPPGSPLLMSSVGDLCEWPSNLVVETALTSSYSLRPMSPDSLEKLEREEEARTNNRPSNQTEGTSELTPMLEGIHVG